MGGGARKAGVKVKQQPKAKGEDKGTVPVDVGHKRGRDRHVEAQDEVPSKKVKPDE